MFEAEIERIYQNKSEILAKAYKLFLNSGSGQIKIGCELEFFLCHKNGLPIVDLHVVNIFIDRISQELAKSFSLVYCVEKERGVSQIEVKTQFSDNLKLVCAEIEAIKQYISSLASKENMMANFRAQPFVDDCGNSLQFNISLHQDNGHNILDNKELRHGLADKILRFTNSFMIFLAPKEDSYDRFSYKINSDLFSNGKFSAPVNLSFGNDNRSCAIRFAKAETGLRLEYRVACAEADSFLVLSAILWSLSYDNSSKIFSEVFGNAFDEKYNLTPLCSSFEQAKELFFSNKNNLLNFFSNEG